MEGKGEIFFYNEGFLFPLCMSHFSLSLLPNLNRFLFSILFWLF